MDALKTKDVIIPITENATELQFWRRLRSIDFKGWFSVVAEFTDSNDEERIHEVAWGVWTPMDSQRYCRNSEGDCRIHNIPDLEQQIRNVIKYASDCGFDHEDSYEGAEDAPPYDQVQLRVTAENRKLETRVISITTKEDGKGI